MIRVITIGILLLGGMQGFGQSLVPQVQLGIRGGYNFSNFRDVQNSNLLKYDANRFGMGGFFAQVRILKLFGVRGEILYNPQGALINYVDSNGVKVGAVRKLSYTDVTLSGMFNISLFELLSVYAFAGYNFANLNSARDAFTEGNYGNRTITDNFERHANSIIMGVGAGIHLGSVNILPELRYLRGITDVDKSSAVVKNKAVTVSLGISFTL